MGVLRERCSLVAMQAATVPDADLIPPCFDTTKQKTTRKGWFFVLLVETAGIEPASASTLQAVLHT